MESQIINPQEITFKPIGYIESWYKTKNGTPHQATVCTESKAKLNITKTVFTNPHHSLEGLQDFSHIWILFYFHENKSKFTKAKVAPPRLNGKRIGVFATRSPHRPNPIGMTLASIDEIKGSVIYLSGIDILDGTPIIDIKPYIPLYDCPIGNNSELQTLHVANDTGNADLENFPKDCEIINNVEADENRTSVEENSREDNVRISEWISKPPIQCLKVRFTLAAEKQLAKFNTQNNLSLQLNFLTDVEKARKSIVDILSADPRSVYRRKHCQDRLYYFTVDEMHITCWFDDDENVAEVLKIKSNK